MHEKRGVITDETPPENKPQPAAQQDKASPVTTKQAADDVEDHATKRAADAVADASNSGS